MSESVIKHDGAKNGIEWSVVVYKNISSMFYAICKVGRNIRITDNFTNAISARDAGFQCMADTFVELEVIDGQA